MALRSVAAYRQLVGPYHEYTLTMYKQAANAMEKQGRIKEAEAIRRWTTLLSPDWKP
jgi:hypothetical protein